MSRGALFTGLVGSAIIVTFLLLCRQYYPFTIDDAFISFRYSENLVQGHGLVYNPGERIEGYTNFLWVMVLAGVRALGGDMLGWAKTGSMLLGVATLGLVGLTAARWWPRPALPGLALVAPALLAVNAGMLFWSAGGLETELFVLLGTAALVRLVHELDPKPAEAPSPVSNPQPLAPTPQTVAARLYPATPRRFPLPLAAALFALATLARPDGAVLFAGGALGAGGWAVMREGRGVWRRWGRQAVAGGLVYGGIVGAHLLFRFFYYGAWVPNTVLSKVPTEALFEAHWDRVADWLRSWGLVESRWVAAWGGVTPDLPPWSWAVGVALSPALLLAAVGLLSGRRAAGAWVLGGAVGVWLVYLARVHADWMPGWRFYLPITPAVVLLMAGGLERIAGLARGARLPGRGGRAVGMGLAFTVGGLLLLSLGETQNQAPVVAGHAGIQERYRAAGLYLRAHAAPGATLAVIDAGAMPYYSGLYTIDYGGLADAHMAAVPYRPMTLDKGDGVQRFYPSLRSDPDYLLARAPDYVQLGGQWLPDGRFVNHLPELALVYQALQRDGHYDLEHPVVLDAPIQLLIVARR